MPLKRHAWDLMCLLFCILLLAAIAARVAYGDEPDVKPQAEGSLLLDFYADWCVPCQSMQPAVDQLVADGYPVKRINIDEEPQLAHMMGVQSIPCFLIVKGSSKSFFGQPGYTEIDRVTGVTTVEKLKVKMQRRPAVKVEVRGQPHPAWRYEPPVGYRAAVVRIYCQTGNSRSIGSGTLVKWGAKKIVVLTARHVIADAEKIIVELWTRKTHYARVVSVDAVWDCAVLELAGEPDGVKPIEVEVGQDAVQREGDRLESCGYGPDGKLACNSGLFIGYRRSTQAVNGPDDWMVISGHARGGDSGGGVFNGRGRLVGVLWGTDGKEVVCVQAGRIHALLDEAVSYQQQAILERNPTPPRPGPMVSVPRPCPPGCDCAPSLDVQVGLNQKKPALPWRGDELKRDASLDARIRGQQAEIDGLVQLERVRQQTPPIVPNPQPPTPNPDDEPSPLLVGLCILAAVVAGFVIYFATQNGRSE